MRLALLDERTGPSLVAAQNRRGLVVLRRGARRSTARRAGSGRTPGGCLLVIPGALPNRRAVLEVAGCQRLPGHRRAPGRRPRWRRVAG